MDPNPRVGSESFQIITGRVGSGRSGQEMLKLSRNGSGHPYPPRPDPTREVTSDPCTALGLFFSVGDCCTKRQVRGSRGTAVVYQVHDLPGTTEGTTYLGNLVRKKKTQELPGVRRMERRVRDSL